MAPREESAVQVQEASFFVKAFTVVGFAIAIAALSWIFTGVVTLKISEATRHWHSIFGIFWGLLAHFFLWTVRRGIKTTQKSNLPPEAKNRVLAEQLCAKPILRIFVNLELISSALLLLFELLKGR